ncbi:hypothetical protein OV203_24730 [Nannocystis sp. ILAH1]|uniref:hypothetical protein n=1 Tax=unclassified Nannocystis TaxID=2627009 RepID=UPI00226EB8E3|nr:MULTISPECIES: hypothetical protein [unclassified Nannocystis]MCY0990369.1 hypothetical protein [Nannocystis sp. ILAH1]MCY1069342.1 hypothetical protein [Nannocystis sp. RBIL2]
MSWKNLALVLSGILVGCAAGAALAQSPAMTPRFEHICMNYDLSIDLDERIAKAADEGWELVTMADAVVCFKRARA